MSDSDTTNVRYRTKKYRPASAGRQKSSLRVLIFFKQFLAKGLDTGLSDLGLLLVYQDKDRDWFRWIWIISCFSKVRICGFRWIGSVVFFWIGSGLSDVDFSLFAGTKMEKITPARKLFRPTFISPRRKSIIPDESRYPGFLQSRPGGTHKKNRPLCAGRQNLSSGF